MSNLKVAGRTLTSLTEGECQTLFALAFGYAPPLQDLFVLHISGPITISNTAQTHSLILYADGQALAMNEHRRGASFNFRKVAGYLDSLNIQIPQS